MNKPYKSITIEISGVCNAKCLWCYTGRKNLAHKPSDTAHFHFMTASEFSKGLQHLKENNLIYEKTEIELYNWGEPLLNPEFDDILQVIDDYKMPFHISTNCSNIKNFTGNHLENMTLFMVSLSGFTEESYGKIHKLNFKEVLKNIDAIADILRKKNKISAMEINFHVYKFNLCEINDARKYFSERGIRFVPRLAYFNDYYLFENFLCNKMEKDILDCAESQLMTDILNDELQYSPADYKCPQMNKLVVDENWNLIPCCRLSSDENQGNILDLSPEKIKDIKENLSFCKDCIKSGQSYIVHRELVFQYGSSDHIMPRRYLPCLLVDYNGKEFSSYSAIRKSAINNNGYFHQRYEFTQVPKKMSFSIPLSTKFSVISDLKIISNCGELEAKVKNGIETKYGTSFNNSTPNYIIETNGLEIKWIEISCNASCISEATFNMLFQ